MSQEETVRVLQNLKNWRDGKKSYQPLIFEVNEALESAIDKLKQ